MREGFFFTLTVNVDFEGVYAQTYRTTDVRLVAEATWPKPETAHEKSLVPKVTQAKW